MLLALTVALMTLAVDAPQDPYSLRSMARERDGKAGVEINVEIPVSTLETLVRNSTMIVRGTVNSARTRLSADEHFVVTEYEIIPARFFKAPPVRQQHPGAQAPLTVVRTGGFLTIDGLELSTNIDCYPERQMPVRGEEVLLFLSPIPDEPGRFRFTGGPFGVFRIVNDTVTAVMRTPDRSGADGPQTLQAFEWRLIDWIGK